ncbi:Cruciform cutting endonuclease 1 like protein [Zymoseptoria brevis]|uniref:Cruciform cutting endonuclease 1 like protein n=1 Tax=Zymoseptoria brevis TaxID=1047168 RepID=A0A0F4GH16_9PEZI|nr:Cruciform cutting endonuclease 1 like protein [Zymoseptoria brevis]
MTATTTTTAIRMANLKAWQLGYWAFLTGTASAGSKAELAAALTSRLNEHVQKKKSSKPSRIVSVDMGIRNLAFCALESSPSNPSGCGKGERVRPMTVTTWKRMDLLDINDNGPAPSNIEQEEESTKSKKSKKSTIAKDAFTPSSLSLTAYTVTKELLSLDPTTLLIERQRFRSGGAAAIQEWTVRVNMLESMLWACLETLRAQDLAGGFPDVHAVNPARVAKFWDEGSRGYALRPPVDLFCATAINPGAGSVGKEAKERKGGVDKKAKVALVKTWVRGESEDVQLRFEGQAEEIAEAFRVEKGGKGVAGGKLDDLADCLLQGVAWGRWEENWEVLGRLWREEGG